jgi:membrane-bound metal-dependent hydrolase YbcI (DUF457 family)
MLVAHLVPGYAAVIAARQQWPGEWNRAQRAALWIVALGSTAAPDSDVIFNLLAHGRAYHSILWTHSLFVHLGIALIWWLLRIRGRSWYLQTLVGLIAIGGLSHLLFDVIAHSTPLFYPFSMTMIGLAPAHIVQNGLQGYLTHPLVLFEPALIGLAVWHWARYGARSAPAGSESSG